MFLNKSWKMTSFLYLGWLIKKTSVGVYLEFKMKRWFLWLVEQLILPSL